LQNLHQYFGVDFQYSDILKVAWSGLDLTWFALCHVKAEETVLAHRNFPLKYYLFLSTSQLSISLFFAFLLYNIHSPSSSSSSSSCGEAAYSRLLQSV